MKQPDEWSMQADRILASGGRPHFAPHPEVLVCHCQLLDWLQDRQEASLRVLVLGATPELADIALERGCKVVRIDCNPKMFEAAAGRQRVFDRAGETRVVGDWLAMEAVADGEVDLVLGDAALNNVPHAQMQSLLDELLRVTRPGSFFSLKQIVMPDQSVPDYEFEQVVAAYREGQLNEDEFYAIVRFYCFLKQSYDPVSRELDAARVFNAVQASYEQGKLLSDEFNFINGRRGGVVHTVYHRAEQVRLLERFGQCKTVIPDSSCYYRDIVNLYRVERR